MPVVNANASAPDRLGHDRAAPDGCAEKGTLGSKPFSGPAGGVTDPSRQFRSVTFNCPFEPRGKGRPRFAKGRTFTDAKTVAFERAVAFQARAEMSGDMLAGPLKLRIFCTFTMPKSWNRKKREELNGRLHTQKPDGDNIIKAIADALNGVVYADDQQIAIMTIEKRWAERGAFGVTVEEIL